MFYLTTHSTHFIYGYMASDIWLRTILVVRKETRCRHIGYSYRLTARVILYAPSHRQDSTYHGLCYTSRGALAGTRNSSVGPPHEGSIRRPNRTMSELCCNEDHLTAPNSYDTNATSKRKYTTILLLRQHDCTVSTTTRRNDINALSSRIDESKHYFLADILFSRSN